LELVDGRGMCPGGIDNLSPIIFNINDPLENMDGSHDYNEFLKKYDASSPTEK